MADISPMTSGSQAPVTGPRHSLLLCQSQGIVLAVTVHPSNNMKETERAGVEAKGTKCMCQRSLTKVPRCPFCCALIDQNIVIEPYLTSSETENMVFIPGTMYPGRN